MLDRDNVEEILFVNDIFDETDTVLDRKDTVFDGDQLISLDLSNLPIRDLPRELVIDMQSLQQLILKGTDISVSIDSDLTIKRVIELQVHFQGTV